MKKEDLLRELGLVDEAVQAQYSKEADNPNLSFKTLDYIEGQSIKAHEAIEWVKQMIEDFKDFIPTSKQENTK